MLPSAIHDRSDPAVIRVERELVRLEAFAARKRRRIALRRGMRGIAGAGGTLATMLKLKLAGSLAIKLGLALLVGLGFAWPLYAVAAVVVGFAILSILDSTSSDAPNCDCPSDCERKESRRARLDRMIAERRAWLLARGSPPAPPPSHQGAVR